MTNLPAAVPKDAPLPQTYEQAKNALAECQRVDECKEWSDKAQALASYAKQADDESLFKMARRIQARAVRRAGKLLEEFQAPGKRTDKPTVGTRGRSANGRPKTQREAAERAGMSEHQERQARRVADVPDEEFEEKVESDDPPSITHLSRPSRPGFAKATHLLGSLDRFLEFCRDNEPDAVVRGLMPEEMRKARGMSGEMMDWLGAFSAHLRGM